MLIEQHLNTPIPNFRGLYTTSINKIKSGIDMILGLKTQHIRYVIIKNRQDFMKENSDAILGFSFVY